MKKILFCIFIIIGIINISCKNDLSEEEKYFEAPSSIDVKIIIQNEIPAIYNISWASVENANDYKLYLKSGSSENVSIPISSNNVKHCGFTLDYITFDKIKLGSSNHKFGVSAVSQNGISSKITWSEPFNEE